MLAMQLCSGISYLPNMFGFVDKLIELVSENFGSWGHLMEEIRYAHYLIGHKNLWKKSSSQKYRTLCALGH